MEIETVGVVGAGAWGSALAQTVRAAGYPTLIWAREPEVVDDINTRHVNSAYLPDIALDPGLEATGDLARVAACDVVLMVAPAQHVRAMCEAVAPDLRAATPVVICAKGIEQASGRLMADVVGEALPAARIAILSGPSFAGEVARGLPAAVTLACEDADMGAALQHALSHKAFRLYWSEDVTGAQIGGAIKNVLAIAAGIVAGKGLGSSAHAALVTRGFAEMTRLGTALGGRPETLTGLSGLGDLILTCSSPQSRNMSLGIALGEGRELAEILDGRRSVSEGVYTAAAVARIAKAQALDLPICAAVHAVVSGGESVDDVIEALLSRPLRAESDC